ncbi:MAG: SxtJ family membrane protein [Pirellulaceae bacterium]
MPLIELNLHPSDRQLRQFATIVIPLCALLVAIGLWWQTANATSAMWVALIAVFVAFGGSIRPALVRPLYRGWMYASYPIGWVIGHLMIGTVFFLVLTPIGWMLRACGHDPLQRKFDASRPSYWEKRPRQERDLSRYFRQF